MSISAADVKALREATGAGMMDCKAALEDSGGDIEAAKVWLREKGLADVGKRSGRTAAEGLVDARVSDDAKRGVLVEVLCETDFVAKGERFTKLAADIANVVFEAGGDLGDEEMRKITALVDEAAVDLREKLQFGRAAAFSTDAGVVEAYLHKTGGWAKKGVLVRLDGDAPAGKLVEAAHELALHIQFARPDYVTADEVPAALLQKERDIAEAKARNEGKPEEIIPRIAEGAAAKFLKDRVLMDQKFVKDEKRTVAAWLKEATGGQAQVAGFARFEVGEPAE
jgi:elongation factor Ts